MNELGFAILKSFEGCCLRAYPDPASPLGKLCRQRLVPLADYAKINGWNQLHGDPWTIGWGDTMGVCEGDIIPPSEADFRLQKRVEDVTRLVQNQVKVPLNNNQLSALVDFAYNEGMGNLKSSTLLREINGGNLAVSAEFERWDKAGGEVMAGLLERRRAEGALWRGDESAVKEILKARGTCA